ncbi:MAG: Rrf2 family transcriptional regulator [Acidobacteria bacterium]|nr:Rrf2 family transcriptional regulator [Acidobacteriota bacterium]
MQLTMHTDFGLRVLLYLAHFPERRVGTEEMSTAYGISRNHLVRVVKTLADGGFLDVMVGRAGGVQLARPPKEIRLGQVVRVTEASFRLVECHDPVNNTCPIVPVCGLIGVLDNALRKFISELDRYTLADLVRERSREKFIQLVSG